MRIFCFLISKIIGFWNSSANRCLSIITNFSDSTRLYHLHTLSNNSLFHSPSNFCKVQWNAIAVTFRISSSSASKGFLLRVLLICCASLYFCIVIHTLQSSCNASFPTLASAILHETHICPLLTSLSRRYYRRIHGACIRSVRRNRNHTLTNGFPCSDIFDLRGNYLHRQMNSMKPLMASRRPVEGQVIFMS